MGPLICLGQRNRAEQPPHVVAAGDPFFLQYFQDRLIALRLGRRAKVGNAGVEAPTHQGRPHSIDVAFGEPGIPRAGQETGQCLATVVITGVKGDALAGKEPRLHENQAGVFMNITRTAVPPWDRP